MILHISIVYQSYFLLCHGAIILTNSYQHSKDGCGLICLCYKMSKMRIIGLYLLIISYTFHFM